MLRSDVYQERMVSFAADEAHCVKKLYAHYCYCSDHLALRAFIGHVCMAVTIL